jgi:endonuclease/exonuclease/phosphatase family metal-dependent hydrolase
MPKARSKSLRLMSYNILEGLQPIDSSANERRHIDRDRAAAARAVVEELHPDILVLNEALFCRQYRGKVVEYGRLFQFPYEVAALYDAAWGNAILTRYPIAKSHEMRIYNRGGLTAVIETPIGELTVASYHPHPARYPTNKASDYVRLIADINGPLIVCGDLNCISPEDVIDRSAMIAACRRFSANPEATVDQFVESGRAVFGALREFGLTDAVPPPGRRYSIPTDLLSLEKGSAMRIDHILANDGVEIVSGEVVHRRASNRASDHHPVMVEFLIGPAVLPSSASR